MYEFLIPDEAIIGAVSNACDFFNLSEVPIVNSEGVCVWANDTYTTLDDVFGVNREQLSDMGIISQDSLMLAYTHECAHRALQDYDDIEGKAEELACDFFAGIHAVVGNIDSTQFEDALAKTYGGETHPDGTLRVEAMEFGKQVASDMQAQGVPLTMENCLDRFEEFLSQQAETDSPVLVYERSLVDSYDNVINSMNEIDNCNDGNSKDISFMGEGDKYTDNEYNRKAAKEHFEKEEELRKKGDNKGAEAEHNIAMKHMGRIRN